MPPTRSKQNGINYKNKIYHVQKYGFLQILMDVDVDDDVDETSARENLQNSVKFNAKQEF